MKQRIVEFEDGKFGIQVTRFFFFKTYIDLKTIGYFEWPVSSCWFSHCKGTLEQCESKFTTAKIKRYL